jgi:site-specific DNA-cytosine methylase
MNQLNVISFCDGSSTGQYVLRRLFPNTNLNYHAFELDRKAMYVSHKHFPDTKHHGDLRNWRTGVLQITEQPDLFIAGTSCKNTSNAGDRTGFATLSGEPVMSLEQYIKYEFQGIPMNESCICFWESIWFMRTVNPKYTFFEIPPLNKKFLDIFIKETGMRYINIDSGLVSAQSRKRWYFTNIPGLRQPEDRNITIDSVIPGALAYSKHGSYNPLSETDPSVKKYSTIRIVKRKDGKMNTIVTTPHSTNQVLLPDGTIRIITVGEAEQFMGYPKGHTEHPKLSNSDRYRILGNGWSIPVIEHIFDGLKCLQLEEVGA